MFIHQAIADVTANTASQAAVSRAMDASGASLLQDVKRPLNARLMRSTQASGVNLREQYLASVQSIKKEKMNNKKSKKR